MAGLQHATREFGFDAGYGIEVRQVDLAGQRFEETRPLQAIHHRALHFGQVEFDSTCWLIAQRGPASRISVS